MGLFFTLFFLLYMLASPVVWIPELQFVPMQIFIAILASLASVPRLLSGSLFRKTPQITVFTVFFGLVMASTLLDVYLRGTLIALNEQLPYLLLMFLIRINVDTASRRRVLLGSMLTLLVALAVFGSINYHRYDGDPRSRWVFRHVPESEESEDAEVETSDFRLKAQGLLDDPNDFAQALLIGIAFSIVLRAKDLPIKNALLLLCSAALFYGVYLTKSRGALVAVAISLTVAFRRKLTFIGSTLIGAAAASGLLLIRFVGGRQISLSEGAERLDLWSEGLQMLKHAPWGIGYHNYTDQVGLTAHNSFLLVAVENGLLGMTTFIGGFVICFYHLNRIVVPAPGYDPDPGFAREARAMELAMTAYLATAWFLSRAYSPLPYMLVALVASLASQEQDRLPDVELLPRWPTLARTTIIVSICALVAIYVLVRLR